MADCILDTHILIEVIASYDPINPYDLTLSDDVVSSEQKKIIHKIVLLDGVDSLIVASAIAFVEIFNRFNFITNHSSRFSKEKVYAFLEQPPPWFVTEDLTIDTTDLFCKIPKKDNEGKNIEISDALHVATAMQRGPNSYLLTNDGRLANMNTTGLNIKIL